MSNHAVHFSSASDEWATPPELFAKLDKEFDFRWDAAATAENSKCATYCSKEGDALSGSVGSWAMWSDSRAIWLNPPYSRGLQARFIRRAYAETVASPGLIVCCLIPARPDTKVWHDTIFPHASEIRFVEGRVKFVGAESGAPFPSAIVIFGQNSPQKISTWSQD